MPKRGLTQPWRVIFLWENGVRGTSTYGSESDAQLFVAALNRRAEQVGRTVVVKMVNRFDDPTPTAKHYKALEAAL